MTMFVRPRRPVTHSSEVNTLFQLSESASSVSLGIPLASIALMQLLEEGRRAGGIFDRTTSGSGTKQSDYPLVLSRLYATFEIGPH